MDTAEIRRVYDRLAGRFDLLEWPLEVLFLRRWRRSLCRHARGEVLEVGVGTGRNLPFYPPGCRITGVDISPKMLQRARARARRLGREAAFTVMDAERLEFPDASFDTVVSTLALCTIPDPVQALREMARVCRPGGRILLLDHVRSDRSWLGRIQDRVTPRSVRRLGCHLNRDTLALARAAGLAVERAERRLGGVVMAIAARPQAGA